MTFLPSHYPEGVYIMLYPTVALGELYRCDLHKLLLGNIVGVARGY